MDVYAICSIFVCVARGFIYVVCQPAGKVINFSQKANKLQIVFIKKHECGSYW